MILFGIIMASVSMAEEKKKQDIDLIVLVDNGFSWVTGRSATDPTGYRFDAAAVAFNLLEANNVRGNFTLFNTKLYTYTEDNKLIEVAKDGILSLKDMSMPAGKANRVQILKDLTASNKLKATKATGGTDIGLALKAAVDALTYYDNGNKKIIVLLTDGGINFPSNQKMTAGSKKKLEEQSLEMIREAKIKAEENGITISSVLLNDTTAVELMKNEVLTSDGTFILATDANELPDCFSKIISTIIGAEMLATSSNVNNESTITITVPNSNIDELSVQIPSDCFIDDTLQLFNPNGEELTETKDDYYIIQGKQYSVIKKIKPSKGDWRITYQGDGSNTEITSRYAFLYDLTTETSVSAKEINKNGSITVRTVYKKNGFTIKDADLYNIPAKLILKKDNKPIREILMDASENEYSYTFDSLKDYGAGEYTISILCEGDGLHLASNEATFVISNKQPIKTENNEALSHSFKINIPGDEESYKIQKCSWDLNNFYTDPDGDELLFEIITTAQNIQATIKGTELQIETLKNTAANEDVIVNVKDTDGAIGKETVFHIDVEAVEDSVDTIVYGPTRPLTKKEDNATIRVQYKVNNTTISTGKYYEIPAYITLKKDKTVLKSGLEMQYNGEEYTYTLTDLKQFGSGIFIAEIRLESGSFVRDCDPVQFELLNGTPGISTGYNAVIDADFIINDPLDEKSYDIQNKEISLNSYYADPDEDQMIWTVLSNEADVNLKIDGPIMTISTKRNTPTNGKVIIGVKDSDGASGPDFVVNVQVVSIEDSIQIECQISPESTQKNEKVVVKSWYIKNNKTLSKEDDLNSIPMIVSLKKGKEIIFGYQPMDFEDGIYTYTFEGLRKFGSGEYTIQVTAENKFFKKLSESKKMILLNSKPKVKADVRSTINHRFDINIPGERESYMPQSWTVDLNNMIEDLNGDAIRFDIKRNTADVKASIINNELTILTEINKPTSGTIEVSVKDEEEEEGPTLQFNVEVISIEDVYDKYTALFKRPTDNLKNSDTELTLYVADENGEPITNDSYLPSEITASVYENGVKKEILMTRQDNGYYTGSIHTMQNEAVYELEANIAVGEKQIKSEPMSFSTKNREPIVIKTISQDIKANVLLGIDSDLQIDLTPYFNDPDGDSLTYTATDIENADCAEIFIDGNTAIIHPKKGAFCFPADYKFTITATDQEELSAISDKATIKIWPVFIMAATIVALIILIIISIRVIMWKNAHFENAAFEVSYGYKGLELPDGISDPLPEGKRKAVPLGNYYTENAREASNIQISQDSLSRIMICPMSKGRVRIVIPEGFNSHIYNGQKIKFDGTNQKYTGETEINKPFVLKNQQSFTVTNNECRVSFKLVKIRHLNDIEKGDTDNE